MIENMNSVPLLLVLMTSPKIARTMPRNVVTTAASCGLLPKGAATKKDQLARTNPRRRWTMNIRPALLSVKTRNFQVRATITQAGRYVNEMATCHDLSQMLKTRRRHVLESSYSILAESSSPIAFMCSVINKALSPATAPGSWYAIPIKETKLNRC